MDKPHSLKTLHSLIRSDEDHWEIRLMDFVDDFRAHPSLEPLIDPIVGPMDKWAALLDSVATVLCAENKLELPAWIEAVPACDKPWFVSGLENLKAISLVEAPLSFRLRKIFVLENFLVRV